MVVALIHGVHGNEISSSGAAVSEAYHLLAARGDAVVDGILRDAIVLVDPSQNPDGRARFLAQNALGSAATPDAEPLAAEHDEPWPGGRSNHYLFDLNRDWFAQAHPETRGRVRTMLEWMPHVVVDLHEMGGDSTYYFPPAAQPSNPWMTPAQHKLMEEFGRANARRFDERGFAYFNREVYDSFYPGYGVVVADRPGRDWHDLRAGVGARAGLATARRRRPDLLRRHPSSLHRRHHHRRHGGAQSRAHPSRLRRLPPGHPRRRPAGRRPQLSPPGWKRPRTRGAAGATARRQRHRGETR